MPFPQKSQGFPQVLARVEFGASAFAVSSVGFCAWDSPMEAAFEVLDSLFIKLT